MLQKATVELLDQALCTSLYGHSLTDRMVCAGYLGGKVDSCQVGPARRVSAPRPPSPGAEGGVLSFWSSSRTSPARWLWTFPFGYALCPL